MAITILEITGAITIIGVLFLYLLAGNWITQDILEKESEREKKGRILSGRPREMLPRIFENSGTKMRLLLVIFLTIFWLPLLIIGALKIVFYEAIPEIIKVNIELIKRKTPEQ